MTLMTRIEHLSPTPDRVGRYRIVFDDGSSMRLYRQTVEDFGLFTGMELDDAHISALRKAAGEMSAKMRAVRIVAASSVSEGDLERRLVQKGEDPEQARSAVKWMSDLSLIDDRRTAEQIVASCARKGYGMARAKQALYEKKIPREFWDEALADYPDQTDWILSYFQHKLPADADEKDIKRAVDAMLRRGHSYHQIRRVLEQYSVDTECFPEE